MFREQLIILATFFFFCDQISDQRRCKGEEHTYPGTKVEGSLHHEMDNMIVGTLGGVSHCIYSQEAERKECWYSSVFLPFSCLFGLAPY